MPLGPRHPCLRVFVCCLSRFPACLRLSDSLSSPALPLSPFSSQQRGVLRPLHPSSGPPPAKAEPTRSLILEPGSGQLTLPNPPRLQRSCPASYAVPRPERYSRPGPLIPRPSKLRWENAGPSRGPMPGTGRAPLASSSVAPGLCLSPCFRWTVSACWSRNLCARTQPSTCEPPTGVNKEGSPSICGSGTETGTASHSAPVLNGAQIHQPSLFHNLGKPSCSHPKGHRGVHAAPEPLGVMGIDWAQWIVSLKVSRGRVFVPNKGRGGLDVWPSTGSSRHQLSRFGRKCLSLCGEGQKANLRGPWSHRPVKPPAPPRQ